MAGIPPALDSDAEDVAWALQTADALWKRNERVDAVVWLRRAAQAAGEAQDDDRALALARGAAELSEIIAAAPPVVPSSLPAPSAVADGSGGVDDLLRSSMSDIVIDTSDLESVSSSAPTVHQMQTHTEPLAFRPVGPVAVPPPAPAPPPAPPPPVPSPSISEAPSTPLVFSSAAQPPRPEEVRTAEEAHAGMLDPWANAEPPPLPHAAAPSTPIAYTDDDEEVVTSVKMQLPKKPEQPPSFTPSLPLVHPEPTEKTPPVEMTEPPPVVVVPSPEPTLVSGGIEPRPPQVTMDVSDEELEPPAPPAPPAPEPHPPEPPPPPPAPPPSPAPPPPPPLGEYQEEPTINAPSQLLVLTPSDLEVVEALSDLPDDARADLAAAAKVHLLSKDEEVTGFSLALVLNGEVDVAAMIVDAPADRIGPGGILKPKGTLTEGVPLRLICATEKARVATWEKDAIEPAFKTCPWVEDDLRAHADRTIALVGVTMGPLADRLDADLRHLVTKRLTVRALGEADVLVEKGATVKEMVIVGQGVIELLDEGGVAVGSVGTGEIVFASEIMGGGKAHATARAGKGGALVLVADRSVAQELLVTCPPLLEIFAGM